MKSEIMNLNENSISAVNTLQTNLEEKHAVAVSNGVPDKLPEENNEQHKVYSLGRSNMSLRLHIHNDENMQETRRDAVGEKGNLNDFEDSTLGFRRSHDNNEEKENSPEKNMHVNEDKYDEASALAARRLELRAQAVEEIQAAKEVKQAELMRLSRAINEARQRRKKEKELKNSSRSFNFADEVPYADSFDDLLNGLDKTTTDPHTLSNKTQHAANAKEDLDLKLSNIQVMQSIILAEEARLQGKYEFKTIEHLTELDTVEMLFHKNMTL